MTEHPITPPPELVGWWRTQPEFAEPGLTSLVSMTESRLQDIATQAARWGADQQLAEDAKRPKPPSLKELALTALHAVATGANDTREQHQDLDTIRRALEALDD